VCVLFSLISCVQGDCSLCVVCVYCLVSLHVFWAMQCLYCLCVLFSLISYGLETAVSVLFGLI